MTLFHQSRKMSEGRLLSVRVGATCVPSSVPRNFREMPQVFAALDADGEPSAGTSAAAAGALRQAGNLAVEPQGRSVQSV